MDWFEGRYRGAVLPDSAVVQRSLRAGRGRAGAAPAEAWALKGCVLSPDGPIDPGWVVVEEQEIIGVGGQAPEGVRTLDTGGVILPGLIDLHGHPSHNIFAPWEPPHLHGNRHSWRMSDEFAMVVKEPMAMITKSGSDHHMVDRLSRYGEIRAVIGGTTTVQGHWGYEDLHGGTLVRAVDLAPFGRNNAASSTFPLDPTVFDRQDQAKVMEGIDDKSITAFYAHVAEGIDKESRDELTTLAKKGLLTSATVLIHGTALNERQLVQVRDAGAKLVWSPQSNLRLYGQTTRASTARKLSIPLTIGADWVPSGSASLLDEIKVARRILAEQGEPIGADELVKMITSGAAGIADLYDHVGHVMTGRPADLLVLERHDADPYESVCQASRASVELVVIDGDLLYGRDDWYTLLTPEATVVSRGSPEGTGEQVWAWGKRMRLDVSSPPDETGHFPAALNRLSDIRAIVLDRWKPLGPIFA